MKLPSGDPWLHPPYFLFPHCTFNPLNLIFKTYLESNHLISITNILFQTIITFHLHHGNSLISLLLIPISHPHPNLFAKEQV